MPVIQDLNDLSSKKNTSRNAINIRNISTQEVVLTIIDELLRKCPQLVVEVESGKQKRILLEKEIIKTINEHREFMGIERTVLIQKVFDQMFGYWLLQSYIQDQSISDIDGTRYHYWTIKRDGVIEEIPVKFDNEEQFDYFCHLAAVRYGGKLNENDNYCRVADEKNRLRISISIRPRNVTGPSMNIRKHREESFALDDLVQKGMLNEDIKETLLDLAHSKTNILFTGQGGAGKTTCLRATIEEFDSSERTLICETDTEIYPKGLNFIVQKVKRDNQGGKPQTLSSLIRDGLTSSLDTYIIGEITGDEAWDFIKNGFNGHRVLGTTHANNARNAVERLITLIKSAGVDHSDQMLTSMISNTVDVIVHMDKFKVMEVLEVTGYDRVSGTVLFNPLHTFNVSQRTKHTVSGEFVKGKSMTSRLQSKLYQWR